MYVDVCIYVCVICSLKASSPGSAAVTLAQSGTNYVATQQFTYDAALTANIASVSPASSSVTGRWREDFSVLLILNGNQAHDLDC